MRAWGLGSGSGCNQTPRDSTPLPADPHHQTDVARGNRGSSLAKIAKIAKGEGMLIGVSAMRSLANPIAPPWRSWRSLRESFPSALAVHATAPRLGPRCGSKGTYRSASREFARDASVSGRSSTARPPAATKRGVSSRRSAETSRRGAEVKKGVPARAPSRDRPWKVGGSIRCAPMEIQRRQRATRSPPSVRATRDARLQAPYPTLRASPRGLRASPRRTQSCKCAVSRNENQRPPR